MSDNLVHAFAGAAGGIVSMSLTYPLMTVTTRLQVQKNAKSDKAYKGSFDAFTKIIEAEGIQGLYSGLNSALFGIAVTNGVYYYYYNAVRGFFEKPGANLSTFETLLSGALAGVATSVITNPIWVVNTRTTAQNKALDGDAKPKSAVEIARSMLEKEGPLSFFQGVLPALILVSNPTIQYFVFEKLKEYLIDRRGGNIRNITDFDYFIMGAIAKLAATLTTYPYIVVKSRMQMKQSSDASKRYDGIMDAFSKITKQEGMAGLYKGLSTKASQSVLTAAILFAAKEKVFLFTLKLMMLTGLRARASPTV